MEYLLLWLAFGVVSMIIANAKNRSGCGWFILGCVFGPFALVVAALPNLTVNGAALARPVALRKCPFCAELIQFEAIKCRFCGSEVPAEKPPKSFAEKLGYEAGKGLREGRDYGNPDQKQ